jgi:hypothetical protein
MVLLGLITETEAVKIGAKRSNRRHYQDYNYLMADPAPANNAADAMPAELGALAAPAKPAAAKKVVKSKVVPGETHPMNPAEADEAANEGRQPIWAHNVKYSDQVANGDEDDDKELEDEADPRDVIVDDDGFVNQFQHNPEKLAEWARDHHLSPAQAEAILVKEFKKVEAKKEAKAAAAPAAAA